MKSIKESVVTAMDGTDSELFPFIPYILQDLWEIGTTPEVILELVKKHKTDYSKLKVLDLGCGKGAVSIKLAKELDCSCLGIDAISEFIDIARDKSKEYSVDHLCHFEVDDIRKRIQDLPQFDVIILGSIGPVFGDYNLTLSILSKHLTQNGIIIIDDGYIEDDSDFTHPLMQKKGVILQQIEDTGMHLVDDVIITKDEVMESEEFIFKNLKKRCDELIMKYPEKKELFENYIKNEIEEKEVLETKVVCSTMVIRQI